MGNTMFYGGPSPTNALLFAIEECLEEWGDDPAYKNTAQKLKEVERELDVLVASPGQRAARRALPPNSSGQERTEEDGES